MFRLGLLTLVRIRTRQAICPLRIELWLAGCLGVEQFALAEGLSDFGGNKFAKGLHDWGMRAMPLFSYTLAFALQLRKSTENLSQSSRLVSASLGAASTGLLIIRPHRLPVSDFSPPLVGTGAFQIAELRGSPHRLTSSQSSQSVLRCGRQGMESPNRREFACH
jgi:hypothetical protein